ncbi:MAG: class I SAM-dependent methyltransferase [Candidatus Omnitrophota bacterium]
MAVDCKKENLGSCPVCQGGSLTRYRRAKRAEVPVPHSITRASYGTPKDLLRCLECGVIFVHPFPAPEGLLAAYRDMKDETYFEEEQLRRVIAERSLGLIERFAKRGRLLDVGCFLGFFLDVARSHGWDCSGVEPSRWARKIAEDRFGLKIVGESLEASHLPESAFDVVTLIDTLEHLPQPQAALSEARRVLKEGGFLYLSTPDIGSPAARILGDRWWGLRPEHVVYFSKPSLFQWLRRLEFEVLVQRSYRRLFTVKTLVRRLNQISPVLGGIAGALSCFPGLRRMWAVLNFFDQIELVARKRSAKKEMS